MDVFRTPDERFEGLPGYAFEPNYTEVDGLRMHYLDEGSGDPVVCFHGEPTWSYLYRKMLVPLVEGGHRVVCPDYAGFGRSDKPTDFGWYSYDRHLETVSAVLAALDLSDATVVVQDWGGPIGLRWAVENADRVARLVILNTGLFTGQVSKGFMAWRDFAEKNPDLPVGFVIQGGTATELPDEVVAAYEAPFPNAESKAGAATFPLLVPTEEGAPGAAEMGAVMDELQAVGEAGADRLLGLRPGLPLPARGRRVRRRDPGRGRAGADRGRRPLPPGGPGRADRGAHAPLPGLARASLRAMRSMLVLALVLALACALAAPAGAGHQLEELRRDGQGLDGLPREGARDEVQARAQVGARLPAQPHARAALPLPQPARQEDPVLLLEGGEGVLGRAPVRRLAAACVARGGASRPAPRPTPGTGRSRSTRPASHTSPRT